jgi:hypothetical protein
MNSRSPSYVPKTHTFGDTSSDGAAHSCAVRLTDERKLRQLREAIAAAHRSTIDELPLTIVRTEDAHLAVWVLRCAQ